MSAVLRPLLASLGIAALLTAPIAFEAVHGHSWAGQCVPVLEGNPGAYPVGIQRSCEAWNVRQAAARGNR